MMSDGGVTELARKHRPTKFVEVVGQTEVVSILVKKLKEKTLPHCILFSGDSGCGKTTFARILKTKLHCTDIDFVEINAAKSRGIDTVREIEEQCQFQAMDGCKIYLIDEAHQLTRRENGDAQTALLKILEDCPDHVYFFLCTTHPQGLRETLKNRCFPIQIKSVSPQDIEILLRRVLKKEGAEATDEEISKVAEAANGCVRWSLQILEKMLSLTDKQARLNSISKSDVEKQAIDLARAVMDKTTKWPVVAKLIKDIDEEPETLRRMILGYASAILLSGKSDARAYLVLDCFSNDYFTTGKPGLVKSCWEMFM